MLSASLPYSLETMTFTNLKTGRVPETSVILRNLSDPLFQQHDVRRSPNHTQLYRSSGALNSCLHPHSECFPLHSHLPSPRRLVLRTVLDVLGIIFWLVSSENVTRQCIVIEYGRINCSTMASENQQEGKKKVLYLMYPLKAF